MRTCPLHALTALALVAVPARAQFADRTVAAGLIRYSLSWGASLVDVDGDGDLDLYAGHHTAPPLLYWNQGNGTFQWFAHPQPWSGVSDRHGAVFVPLDDDERPDVLITHGGSGGASVEANEVYRNEDGITFTCVAAALGLDDPAGRTRGASAADFDGDLRLDVWAGKAPRVISFNSLFRNLPGPAFTDVAAAVGLDEPLGTVGGIWGDVDDDGDPDLLVGGEEFGRPTVLWRNDGGTFADASAIFSPALPVISGADWGDYDLDGDLDLAVCDGNVGMFDSFAEGDTVTFYFNTRFGEDGLDGLTVPGTADTLRATFASVALSGITPVYLGPAAEPVPAGQTAVATDAHVGAPSFVPGVDQGIWLWRTAPGGSWEVRCSTPDVNYDEFSGALWDGTVITGVTGTQLEDPGLPPGTVRVWRNDGGAAFAEVSPALGLPAALVNPRDVSWVDYDNDGDPDLHVVDMGTSADPNAPDALFRNDGALFTDVTAIEGVAGGTDGLGDGGVWGDVDNDGDLDLYLRQGAASALFSQFGPALFLRNDGPRGSSVQLDLTGVAPAVAAVGAVVDVIAGDLRVRRRVSANAWRGYQDPLRVHAGIGAATQADTVRIAWPSGVVTVLTDVPAGILAVREDDATEADPGARPFPGALRVEGPFPQPAPRIQELAVFLPRAQRLTVSVHDVAGRLVRRLHDGPAPSGRSGYAWDGTDANGAPVAGGVYFLRVRSADGDATARSVRLR